MQHIILLKDAILHLLQCILRTDIILRSRLFGDATRIVQDMGEWISFGQL